MGSSLKTLLPSFWNTIVFALKNHSQVIIFQKWRTHVSVLPFREEVKKISRRVLLSNYAFDIKADKLLKLLTNIEDNQGVIVWQRRKAQRKAGAQSFTRSEYIGVTKYGQHWQAFITISNRKIYIGSYKDERDAAIAFDFYSILHHKLVAKTNFSYSKLDILEMISNFKINGENFKPEKLIMNL